jgi:hypothetical protein
MPWKRTAYLPVCSLFAKGWRGLSSSLCQRRNSALGRTTRSDPGQACAAHIVHQLLPRARPTYFGELTVNPPTKRMGSQTGGERWVCIRCKGWGAGPGVRDGCASDASFCFVSINSGKNLTKEFRQSPSPTGAFSFITRSTAVASSSGR